MHAQRVEVWAVGRLRIREWRRYRALSQRELADMAGMTAANLCRIEANEQEPQPSTKRAIAEALAIRVHDLYRRPRVRQRRRPATTGRTQRED